MIPKLVFLIDCISIMDLILLISITKKIAMDRRLLFQKNWYQIVFMLKGACPLKIVSPTSECFQNCSHSTCTWDRLPYILQDPISGSMKNEFIYSVHVSFGLFLIKYLDIIEIKYYPPACREELEYLLLFYAFINLVRNCTETSVNRRTFWKIAVQSR